MKTTRYLFLTLLMALVGMSAEAQQRNVLQVPDVTTQAGNVQLPVSIENTDEIVGAQFDLTLPSGVTAEAVGIMANRSDGHSVTVSRLSSGVYRVLLHSSQNRPLRGQSGVVMYLPITIPATFEEGSEHALSIANAVLGKVTGENVLTEAIAGKIRISKLPDLTVKSITCDKQSLSPGDRLVASWQVENIGELATGGGWSEQVSLVSEDGTQSKLIATTHYDDVLDAGGVVSRQVEITLPTLLGLDGPARLQVRIVPDSNTGESTSAQGNNTQTSSLVNINKVLTLELTPNRIDENVGRNISLRVNRSGRWTAAETFALTTTADTRVSVPSSITIPANQAGAIVYFNVTDNDVLDEDSVVTITATGNGYPDATGRLVIEDNEYPDLTLTASKTDITEGETFQLTVTASRASAQPITVTLTSENQKRFTFPQTVTIAAGETTATVDVTAVDDELPSMTLSNIFIASAPSYNKGEVIVLLEDNDIPTLNLTLTPNAISEAAGPTAVVATLLRTDNINKVVTVKFSDDSDGGIYYGRQTVEMPAGVEKVIVNLGPIDNAIVDGERTYNISAAVWIASCNCNVQNGNSGGVVTAPLTVYDNDGPALSLSASASTVKEGDEIVISVSRNTDTSTALSVSVSSDHDSTLEYPVTVTIPANETSASFTVKSVKNDVNDDSFTAIMTVESEGYSKANVWFMVSDQTLPDAQITAMEVSDTEVKVGTDITVTATLTNTGSYELPELTKVGFYHDGSSIALATAYLQAPLAAGESVVVSKSISLPDAVGTYNVYAVANDGQAMKELLYTNNTSSIIAVKAVSPFAFTVQTNKNAYQQGETINISGSIQGTDIANKAVEVYVINDGYRHVINVTTDGNGDFCTAYQPYAGQIGHFAVGVCYPKEGLTESLTSFDVYGIKRTSNSYITCKTLFGEDFSGSFEIKNPGALLLTGVKASIVSQPANCVVELSCPQTLTPNETASVDFKITPKAVSEGNEWEHIVLNIETNEGAKLETTLYHYCFCPTGKVKASIASINTTMTKDASRDYPFVITNIGKGETGKISLALPSWMSSVTPALMPSMTSGDSLTVILRLNPSDDMALNVPVTGQIGINCDNGEGLAIPFSVEPVSDDTGTLTIDVCDEYTYYTAESPHVQGAQVTVKHPTTGALLASGTTDENGKFSVSLNEGYYAVAVSADHHDSYRNNILVDPGMEKNITVNLSYQAITVNWEVEETEVEDEYKIVTKVTYETNVPTPVIVVGTPENLNYQSMSIGESVIVQFTVTNKGLITAKDVEVFLPEATKDWVFDYLEPITPFDLAPQQTVFIPARFTRQDGHSWSNRHRAPGDTYRSCMANMEYQYNVICGKELKDNRGAAAFAVGTCMLGEIGSTIGGWFGGGGGGGGLGSPNSGGASTYTSSSNNTSVTSSNEGFCDPCQTQLAWKTVDCLLGFVPVWGCSKGVADCATGAGSSGWRRAFGCATTAVSCTAEVCAAAAGSTIAGAPVAIGCTIVGWLANIGQCLVSFTEPCNSSNQSRANSLVRVMEKQAPSYLEEFQQKAQIPLQELTAYQNWLYEIIGDSGWENVTSSDLAQMLESMCFNDEETFDVEKWMKIKPEEVSSETFLRFLERTNNTIKRDNGQTIDSDNCIDYEILAAYASEILDAEEQSMALGFASTQEMWLSEYQTVKEKLSQNSNSICSSVTVQFEQNLVLTRQAFRGTLTVFNGSETTAMTDVKLKLVVTDEEGIVATSHEFQINPESLTGFAGNPSFDEGWTLEAQATGVAKILFIPTKYAAPTVGRKYSFGGILTYIDPFTGLETTRTLTPITLTVKPSPELDLTYFMQRDVYGDDPLTEEVEQTVPAEFALLINNKGYGDATNVNMVTQQPEIIENEKGLLIDFELISSQVNGGDAALAFGEAISNDFGTIPAHSQMYAQWWLTSSLLGHFTDYKVEATHVTSYGNEDLSLLDEVTIHELIHGFTVGQDGENPLRGFLVNDIVDAEDLPDAVYFTDATQQGAYITSSVNIVKQSDTEYVLTVNVADAGWNYGSLLDPTYGKQRLVKVVRADGTEVNVDNIWQTDRTLRDGKDPLYENRLHFIGNMSAAGETFRLTFEPKPELELEVESYAGVPEEGTVLTEQLTDLTVKFNKPIKAESFTTDDITLNCQGVSQDASQIVIEQVSESEFKLKLNEVTLLDGYYVLTVQTAAIEDNEGFTGTKGKQAAWIQFVDGKVALKVTASPAEGGTVTPASGRFDYDSDVTLKAVAAEGYNFTGWMLDGQMVSTNSEYSYHLTADAELKALFTIKYFDVTIEYDVEQGSVLGGATGIFPYGEEIHLTAQPNSDYAFDGWIVNGELVSMDSEFTITVNSEQKISATFKRLTYQQEIKLSSGWNWVSTYLNEPLAIETIVNDLFNIVGQFAESIEDPEYGMVGDIYTIEPGHAYKLNAKQGMTSTYIGRIHNIQEKPIMLNTGWNWISYPYAEEKYINDVLSNASEGDYMTSQFGFSEFVDGYWEGTLNTLTPGYGYIYKSSTDKAMTFDFSNKESRAKSMRANSYSDESIPEDIDVHKYPSTMNIISRISTETGDLDAERCRIYAFAGNELRGESRCVGDNHYLTIYGDNATDITFVVENTMNGDTYFAKETVTFRSDVLGSRKAPFNITISGTTAINDITESSRKMKIYSIEGILINSKATTESLKKLSRGIYIIDGQKFMVK